MKITAKGHAVLENDKDMLLSRWVEEHGVLCVEGVVFSHYLPLIPEGGTVVDAGAALGDHTIAYLSKVGPKGTVIAFEPNPDYYACLVHNCPDATCYNLGLGATKTRMGISLNKENAGASFLCEGKEVIIDPLDAWKLERLDFMKLDVEGMELQALMGAEATIRRCKPVIVMECNPPALQRQGATKEQIYAFMDSLGYSVSIFLGVEGAAHWELICRPK